jgi:uncharacterized protein YqjF (DUF2071 family)
MAKTSTFLTAEWRKLAIANYAVDKKILTPLLPNKTELDLWQDKCYVSLVGFMFLNTRLKSFRIPFHRNFEEVNLRFYVRYKENSIWKRGVTFIKEIVPKPTLTFIANTFYKEKYETLPMSHSWVVNEDFLEIEYRWKKKNWNSFSVKTDTLQLPVCAWSEEEFITEHYWGYTKINDLESAEYGVEHRRWNTYNVISSDINVDFEDVYGSRFSFLSNQTPDSVMLAEGSEIVVKSGNPI